MTTTENATQAPTTRTIEYTETQATEEALRLFVRKIARLHPAAYSDVIAKLPYGAREALAAGEMRADTLFLTDRRDGIARAYPTAFEDTDEDESGA